MTKRYFITIFCTGVLLLTSMPGCTVVNPEMGVTDGYNTYDDNYYYDDDRDNDYEDSDRIPPVVFYEQPQLVVIPDTYIYVAPDVNDDIFFYDGWWWRPWNGSWYRSHHYSKGWRHYRDVPRFYRDIPGNWRSEYRKHRWKGHEWNHKRIPYKNLERNRNEWEKREKRRDGREDNKHDRYERVNPERNQNDRRERYKRERNNNERQDRFNPENRQDNNNRRERIITPENPEPNNNNRRERIIPEQNNRNRERPVTPEVEHNNNNNRRERYNRQEREAAPQPKKPEELLKKEYPKEQSQRHKKGPLDPIETP